jgi:probable F420-dependent oxidoreductase
MKFGLFGFNMRPCVTPDAIAQVARAAEAAGFESMWGGEHLALADPQTPDSPLPPRTEFVDLISAAAFAGAHTRTLRFVTGILLITLRNPVILAKQVASLDALTGGRFTLGVGIGNLAFEFAAVGAPFASKGHRAEEAVAAMRALWSMERAEFHGRWFSFAGVRAAPPPAAGARMPIVWGGKSAYAFARAARSGDGWFGYALDLDATRRCIDGIRTACAKIGRSPAAIEISVTPKGSLDRDLARRYADLGVARIVLPPPGRDVDEAMLTIATAERDLIGRL